MITFVSPLNTQKPPNLMKKMFFGLIVFAVAGTSPLWSQPNSDVMLQGFNWESHDHPVGWYNAVWPNVQNIAQAGIDIVWMPPPSDATDAQGYLPRRLYTLNSSYGSMSELQALIENFNNRGIETIADIVINHRTGTTGFGDFTNPTWGCDAVVIDDGWSGACGNPDTGELYDPARDIDHTNPQVQQDLINWLNFLKNDIGFSGWRYDYVQGFAPSFINMYNNASNPAFSVGELWPDLDVNNPDPNRQAIVDWIDATGGASKAFDFTTKGILQVAVNGEYHRLDNGGELPGLIGWWPAQSVTFVDNHDTGSTQNYWPFPGNKVMQGYAYILTHPGTPTVFWDHLFDWGLYDEIKDLIWIRKKNELTDESDVEIAFADGGGYGAYIDGKVAMKIGPSFWSPPSGEGWSLKASGEDYAVWDKLPDGEDDFTVYVRAPSGISGQPKIHYWDVEPSGESTDWPGADLTKVCDRWYKYTFEEAQSANFLFHNNQGTSTDDLFASADGWYLGNKWADSQPSICGGVCEDEITFTIRFPSSWTQPSIYLWNSVPETEEAAWPGFPMEPLGNRWYRYTAECAGCTEFIVSNNGSNQTEDLSTCSDIVYPPQGAAAAQVIPHLQALDEDRITLNPNPADAYIQVGFNYGADADVTVEVFDLSGKRVLAPQREIIPAGNAMLMMDVNDLAVGMYLLRVQGEAGTETAKFFKR